MCRSEIAIGQAFGEDGMCDLLMHLEPLGLAILLVPTKIQPAQPVEDRIERCLGIAFDVRIVDAQNHGAAVAAGIKPIENKGPRAADMQIASGGGRKTNSQHGKPSITRVFAAP